MSSPELSVVLALHGQRPLTEQCLRTLLDDVPNAEIVCVDNASRDDTLAWLQRQPGVVIVTFPENRGVPAAWNAGLRRATGQVLCVLNNDVLVLPGGMRSLADAAARVGIAALCGGVLDEQLAFERHTADAAEADYPNGCALAFRREVYQHVGEFDEGLGLGYYEDADWGTRARSLGYAWTFVPDAVEHLESRTAARVPELEAFKIRNQRRFRERWQGVITRLRTEKAGATSSSGQRSKPMPFRALNGSQELCSPEQVEAIANAVLVRLDREQEIDSLAEAVLGELIPDELTVRPDREAPATRERPPVRRSSADLLQIIDHALFLREQAHAPEAIG